MSPIRCFAALSLAMVISANGGSSEVRDVNTIPMHRYQITSSSSPQGTWKLTLKASADEDRGPTMWLVGEAGAKELMVGELQRDAELVWCPTGRCLLILEEPSIEDMRVVLYKLGSETERVSGLDGAIRKRIRASIGNQTRILFYAVRPLKWLDSSHIVLATQVRYVKQGQDAPAELFTEGYVVNLYNGSIDQRVSAQDLKSKYGFAERIA